MVNCNLVFLVVFENWRLRHAAVLAVDDEGNLAFHVERHGAVVARLVGRVNPHLAYAVLLGHVENHVVELLDGRQLREALFREVDCGKVALDADGRKHFLEEERHVLAVATTLLECHFGGLRDKAVAAEADIAVADIVAHEVRDGLHGLVPNLVALHLECLLAHAHSLLELVLDEVLVVFADFLPLLLAGEHQACAKIAVHGHVEFLSRHDGALDFPFAPALDVFALERSVFLGGERVRVGVHAEYGLAHGNVLAAHEVGVGNHALRLDGGAAELQINEVARRKFREREVRHLAFVLAADFGRVGDVGAVEASLLFQVPVAVVHFERVEEYAVVTRQKIESELAVDGGTSHVEDFHEHLLAPAPRLVLFGLQAFLAVVHHGGEVALDCFLLGLRAQQALDVAGTFFHGRDGLLQRAVVCLPEERLGGAEEAFRVFVVGLERERLGERLFGVAVVVAVEEDFTVHGPQLVIVLFLLESFFADGAGFLVAAQEHEGVHEGFAQILAHPETASYPIQYFDGFGVLVQAHVGLCEVHAQAAARLRVIEALHHNKRLVALSESPERVGEVDDVFGIVRRELERRFRTLAGVAVVEQHLVHFAENREEFPVLAHQRHLACKVGDARSVEFLHLVDEPAVHEVERFLGVHLVRALEVAERHERLVFHQAEDTHLVHDGGIELVLLLGAFGIGRLRGLGSHGEPFDGVVYRLRVFLLRCALRPGRNQNSASVLVEEPSLVGKIEIADHVGEREFLGVAVADFRTACIERAVVRVHAQAGEEHLEHILLVNHVGREDGTIYK